MVVFKASERVFFSFILLIRLRVRECWVKSVIGIVFKKLRLIRINFCLSY